MDVSIVIPLYNESESLKELNEWINRSFIVYSFSYEIIYIDDGSNDKSWKVIEEIAKSNNNVKGISFNRNYGKSQALRVGFDECEGKYVATLDADLQDPPEILPKMFEKMKEGYDVVYGKRAERYGESILYKACCWIYYKLAKIFSDIEIPENTGDFRLIKREIVDLYLSIPESPRSLRSIFPWLGFNQIGIEYKRDERNLGKTKYHFLRI